MFDLQYTAKQSILNKDMDIGIRGMMHMLIQLDFWVSFLKDEDPLYGFPFHFARSTSQIIGIVFL